MKSIYRSIRHPYARVNSGFGFVSRCVAAWMVLAWVSSEAATIEIRPGDSFENAAESLQPGDTLIVHAGTYVHSNRTAIVVRGTSQAPVLITGASGEARPVIQLNASGQNVLEIDGATFVTLQGMEITANGISGADGINLRGNPANITMQDLIIHDIAVGINFRSSMTNILVRRNEIYNTSDTGEGLYIGCHDGSCAVSNSIVEYNWIHHTNRSDQGDGIEVKRGSHSNIIRDNVIHDTNYPCILLYGTDGNPRNIVERNVMWNCPDAAIQVAADTILRNNIMIPGNGGGLTSQSHAGVNPANVEFVHNTIIGGNPCIRLSGWDSKPGMVFANNAVYCASNNYSIGGMTGVQIVGNVFLPRPSAFPAAGNSNGRSLQLDFVDSSAMNYYPSSDSPLLGAGNPGRVVADDFNGTARTGAVDAGAYTWVGAGNPGWPVGPGFKGGPAMPVVMLTADPVVVDYQGSTTLDWTTSNATSCTASGDWAGPKSLIGSEVQRDLVSDKTYTLSCVSSDGQQGGSTVEVTVDPAPTPGPPSLSFSADATSLAHNTSTVLRWNGVNVSNCAAGGGWQGSKPNTGSESVGPLTASTAFDLSCVANIGGSVSRTVQVSVNPPPGTGTPGGSTDTGGSGSLGMLSLLFLGNAIRIMRRRRFHGPSLVEIPVAPQPGNSQIAPSAHG